ncbi:MAG TPA: alpha/beta fold hydrolase [Ilumatobacteraceae bacterium]|nr:alpha/beta fold hydrolase [Ilumatobacteraceae bacterium]
MSETPDATAADELPVVVPASTGDLLAVVTTPTGPAAGLAAVLLRGAGWRPSSGPRRTQVRLARRLAAAGVHGVRFSYHGVAESGGQSEDIVRLDQPFVEDVDAVARWLAGENLRPVLVGNCFGARTALSFAAGQAGDAEVAGLALIVPPVHDFEVARRLDRRPLPKLARRVTPTRAWAVLRDPVRRRAMGRTLRALSHVGRHRVRAARADDPVWLSRSFCRELDDVTARGIPVLVVYGDDDNYFRDFELARAGTLGDVVTRAGTRLELRVVPGKIHGLTSIETQEATLDAVEDWVHATLLPGSRRTERA